MIFIYDDKIIPAELLSVKMISKTRHNERPSSSFILRQIQSPDSLRRFRHRREEMPGLAEKRKKDALIFAQRIFI